MIELQRILCPIDFSDYSRHALDHATTLARWYESDVDVLYVHPIVPVAASAPGAPLYTPLMTTARDRDQVLESMRCFAGSRPDDEVPMTFEVIEGSAAPVILERGFGPSCPKPSAPTAPSRRSWRKGSRRARSCAWPPSGRATSP